MRIRSRAGHRLPDGGTIHPSDDAPAKRAAVLKQVAAQKEAGFHVDLESGNPRDAAVRGIALSTGTGKAAYLTGADTATLVQELSAHLEGVLLIGHDLKDSLQVLILAGAELKTTWFDTMLAQSLIDPEQRQSLTYLCEALLGYTPGTQRAFTEAQVKDVIQKCYTAGGEPDTIMLPPAAKQTFSTFTGNATRMDKSEDSKLYASVDYYVSDFGTIQAVPNRFMATRDVFLLQSDKLAIAYLRPFQTMDIAKTGDSDAQQIIVEYTLECRAPKAHGAINDIL